MAKVAVLGATGYTGLELVRILYAHPEAEVAYVSSRTHEGERLSGVFPELTGLFDAKIGPTVPDALPGEIDLAFVCLPHKAAMDIVPGLLEGGLKVVDLSADFRFRESAPYEEWYQPHSAPELLGEAVYGLPELYREKIASARLVANPGCYPTAVTLGLAPLLKAGLIDPATIIANAASGATGAGRGVAQALHFCEVNESFRAYKVAEHRHTPEMEQELSALAGQNVTITFIPHLVPMLRGIFATLYASLTEDLETTGLEDVYEEFYGSEPFVRLISSPALPDTVHSRGTNLVTLGVRADPRTGRVIVMSAIDNLNRGAAGQAVANMNLMLGLDETLGLDVLPWRP